MYGIIGAMSSEIILLREHMREIKEEKIGVFTFYQGVINGSEVVLVKCGIGKVNAAMCAQIMIDRFAVTKLINTGIAGGVGSGLSVGDVVIGVDAVQHDFDMRGLGYAKGYMTGEDMTAYTVYQADEGLVAEFRAAVSAVVPPEKIKEGRIATGDIFVSDSAVKKELREGFASLAAEMEGAAILQVAEANKIPAVIIRAISDLADEGAEASVENFEQFAADISAETLLVLLEQAAMVPVLL
ncbi:MAG: 5'-methylthioadenosine/adenosylhomocysteine nucleosidase [Christensenellaceae bacterium]|jgi:adenosylhomocysteine nucleosidase